MKNSTKGTLSGCLIRTLSASILGSFILPIFLFIGILTSFSQYAIAFTGNYLCPDGTVPKGYTYQTTTTDKYGNVRPATSTELHCIDQNGMVVKNDPVVYAFLWIGIFILSGLILSGVLALLLAAPAGILIAHFLDRRQKTDISASSKIL